MPASPLPASPTEGSTLYYALLRVPGIAREKVLATLELCQILANTLNDVSEPGVAETKIHWWHEEIERLHRGEARHPSTQRVAALLSGEGINPANWLSVLSANSDEKFINAPDESAYQTRLQKDYNTRMLLCSKILQDQTTPPSPHWAAGFGQFDRLRNFHHLHNQGYPVFPDKDYTTLGIEPADVGVADKHGQVAKLFTRRIESAIKSLEAALTEPDPAMQAGSLPFYIMATIRKAQLTQWQQQSLLPSEAYSTPTPLRKAWLAWRCRYRYRMQSRGI